MSLSLEQVSLAEVMDECQAMIEPQRQARGIGMTFPRFALPCVVDADRTRLKQVIINLLSNALKYNRPGGQVAVECFASTPGRVRISISDTGPGIAPVNLPNIFDRFYQAENQPASQTGGTYHHARNEQMLFDIFENLSIRLPFFPIEIPMLETKNLNKGKIFWLISVFLQLDGLHHHNFISS